jgi:hypothetical protein
MTEEFDVDVSPRDLVSWIKKDQEKRSPSLWATVLRSIEKSDIEAARVSLDDDILETMTRGVLEVQPRRGPGGWLLRVSVEDTTGEHPISDENAEEESEELTLDAFQAEFLQPEGRPVDVTVFAEDGRAKARFDRWLSATRARAGAQAPASSARRPAARKA